MKKEIPNIINIQVPYDPFAVEGLFLWRYNQIIKNGYTFPIHDFNLFCAILIKKQGEDSIPEFVKSWAFFEGKVKPEIKFLIIRLQEDQQEPISDRDLLFYKKMKREQAISRRAIVKKEITRTGVNPNLVTISNSQYYRNLLYAIREFEDLTLIDWFVPIVLKFDRFVHIYVKHVEETQIAQGNFKNRSFFDYKWEEILTLIKKVLSQEEESIKDHFVEVAYGRMINDSTRIKPFLRGIRSFPPITLSDDIFRLSINEYGFIQTCFQMK